MTELEGMVLEQLRHAVRRDCEKGGCGFRSTVDIADCLGVKTAVARRTLNKLLEAGAVDCFDRIGGCGNALHWRLADHDPDDGERLLLPLAA